jgi:hypothetical protein
VRLLLKVFNICLWTWWTSDPPILEMWSWLIPTPSYLEPNGSSRWQTVAKGCLIGLKRSVWIQ